MIEEKLIEQDNELFIGQSNVRKLSFKMRFWRWVVLGLIAIFLFSNTMSSSVTGSLQEQVIEALHTDYDGYNMLISAFNLPNIINPFIAGVIIDIVGARIGLIGYSTFIVIGITVQYIATTQGSFNLMLVGIISFSIGTASMQIIIPFFVSIWFIGKQLSLSLGTITASSNLGAVLAFLSLPPLYKKYQTVTIPYLICAIMQGIGYASVYGICGIDYNSEKDDKKRKTLLQQQKNNQKQNDLNNEENNKNLNEIQIEDINKEQLLKNEKNDEQQINNDDNQTEQKKKRISFRDFKKLNNLMYWLILGVNIFQQIAMYFLLSNFQHILIKFYNLEEVGVGRILSASTLSTGLLAPLFAHITDKIGKRAEFFILSSVIQCITLLFWMYIPVCQEGGCYWFYIPIITNGLATSITAAAYYPSVTLVVDKQVLGSSFGFSDCLKSIGLFVTPFIFGSVMKYGQRPEVNSYFWLYALCLSMSLIALIFSILVYIYDKKTGNRLNAKQGEYEIKSQISEKQENELKKSNISETRISMTVLN